MKPFHLTIAVLFLILFVSKSSIGQIENDQQNNRVVDSLFKNSNELYFVFEKPDKYNIGVISKIVSIDNLKDNSVYAYANKKEFIDFLQLQFPYKILTHPGKLINPIMSDFQSFFSSRAWNSYPTYQAYDSIMHQFEIDYPGLCKVHNIGTLSSGRKLLAVKISDSIETRENEPQFLYTATMHGDETTGYVLMLRFIDYLLSNYGTDSRVTNLVNSIEIWINPLANPDGTYNGGNNSVYGATRYNSNGIDLNRNYHDLQTGPHPDGFAWQPETVHFMNLADSNNFVMAANFHGGAELVNYPWDTWAVNHADKNWWELVSYEYADTAQFNSPSGYFDDYGSGVTNGYVWYEVDGGRQDYMNYFHQCREFTLEISSTKILPSSQLMAHWDYNYRSALNYLEQCLYGIRGIVTDSLTGQPLKAKVFISGHDIDSSHVYSSLPAGNYHRPIYTGSYSLTFSAPGYNSKTISNVTATNYSTTVLDVELVPKFPVASFSAEDSSSCTGIIKFIGSTSQSYTSYFWDFGDGTFSYITNPVHTYNSSGIFDVKYKVTNCIGTDSLIVTNCITINLEPSPVVTHNSSCGPDSLTLTANGSGILKWYDSPSGGALLYTGSVFVTPFLNNTTTYYVQDEIVNPSQYGGKPDNTGGGGYFTNNTSHYLIFDCYTPVKLKSVLVYANGSGNRMITLRDNNGSVLQSATINIPNGQSRITLDFDIPVGNNLQLAGPTSPDLYRNNGGISYPYNISNLVSIIHSSANSNPTGYYYYFYDWEIVEKPCLSPVVPVNAFINLGNPTANFNYLVNGLTVDFTNLSVDGNSYVWNFDDGNTSTNTNPTHTYVSNGSYNVSLLVNNACGTDSVSIPVLITSVNDKEISTNTMSVFPNPSSGLVNIIIDVERRLTSLSIYSITGQKVVFIEAPDKKLHLDLSKLKSGIYFIHVKGEDINLKEKLLIF